MKPKEKEYDDPVVRTTVWEEINGEHHLIDPRVSAYIRGIEEDMRITRELLMEKIKENVRLKDSPRE